MVMGLFFKTVTEKFNAAGKEKNSQNALKLLTNEDFFKQYKEIKRNDPEEKRFNALIDMLVVQINKDKKFSSSVVNKVTQSFKQPTKQVLLNSEGDLLRICHALTNSSTPPSDSVTEFTAKLLTCLQQETNFKKQRRLTIVAEDFLQKNQMNVQSKFPELRHITNERKFIQTINASLQGAGLLDAKKLKSFLETVTIENSKNLSEDLIKKIKLNIEKFTSNLDLIEGAYSPLLQLSSNEIDTFCELADSYVADSTPKIREAFNVAYVQKLTAQKDAGVFVEIANQDIELFIKVFNNDDIVNAYKNDNTIQNYILATILAYILKAPSDKERVRQLVELANKYSICVISHLEKKIIEKNNVERENHIKSLESLAGTSSQAATDVFSWLLKNFKNNSEHFTSQQLANLLDVALKTMDGGGKSFFSANEYSIPLMQLFGRNGLLSSTDINHATTIVSFFNSYPHLEEFYREKLDIDLNGWVNKNQEIVRNDADDNWPFKQKNIKSLTAAITSFQGETVRELFSNLLDYKLSPEEESLNFKLPNGITLKNLSLANCVRIVTHNLPVLHSDKGGTGTTTLIEKLQNAKRILSNLTNLERIKQVLPVEIVAPPVVQNNKEHEELLPVKEDNEAGFNPKKASTVQPLDQHGVRNVFMRKYAREYQGRCCGFFSSGKKWHKLPKDESTLEKILQYAKDPKNENSRTNGIIKQMTVDPQYKDVLLGTEPQAKQGNPGPQVRQKKG
jgi:hypothetical protein